MTDWGEWTGKVRDNPSRWAVTQVIALVGAPNVLGAAVRRFDERNDPGAPPVTVRSVVATTSALLVGEFHYRGQGDTGASVRALPWSSLTGVEIDLGGYSSDEQMPPTSAAVRFGAEAVTLPLGDAPGPLSDDEVAVVSACLARPLNTAERTH